MAEREAGRDPTVLVAAVADVETLLVALHRLAVHAFGGALVRPRRMVVEAGRDRQRQAATGIGHAEEHVDERLGLLLAGEERRQDRRRTVGPGRPVHRDRRAGVDDHGRARVGRADAAHEFVLATGQVHRGAIEPLGLPLVVRADHHDGHVGGGRRGDRAVHEVDRLGGADADADRGETVLGDRPPQDVQRDRHAGRAVDGLDDLDAPVAEELLAARELGVGIVDDHGRALAAAGDHLDRTGGDHADLVRTVGVRDELSRDAHGERPGIDARGDRPEEAHEGGRRDVLDEHLAVPRPPVHVLEQQPGLAVRLTQLPAAQQRGEPIGAHAGFERDGGIGRRTRAEPLGQRGEQRPVVERGEARRPAAHALVRHGVRPDDGDARDGRGIERQHRRRRRALVAQQHGAADGCPPCECPFGRIVDRLLLVGDDELVGAHAVDHRQHVEDQAVDLFLVDLAGLHGLDELRAVHPHRRGHLDVEPGIGRLDRVVDAEPVGHDEAVEAPLVAEDVGEQATVLGAVFGAEAVVGAHDPPGAALLDRALERAEVDLAAAAGRRPVRRPTCGPSPCRCRRSV